MSLALLIAGSAVVSMLLVLICVIYFCGFRLLCECDGAILKENRNSDSYGDNFERQSSKVSMISVSKVLFPCLVAKREDNIIHLPDARRLSFYNKKQRTDLINLDCAICLDKFKDGSEVIALNCRHGYHENCLYHWVKVKKAAECPLCKTVTSAVGIHDPRSHSEISTTQYGSFLV